MLVRLSHRTQRGSICCVCIIQYLKIIQIRPRRRKKERKKQKIPLPFWNARWPSTMTDCFGLCRLFERQHSTGKMGNDASTPNGNFVVIPTGSNSKWSQTHRVILFILFFLVIIIVLVTVRYLFFVLFYYCSNAYVDNGTNTFVVHVTFAAHTNRPLINYWFLLMNSD